MNNASDQEKEYYKRIDEVVHYIWDPIGICDEPNARDEYYGYLPGIHKATMDGCTAETMSHLLQEIVYTKMGLKPNLDRCLRASKAIISWKQRIFETTEKR